MSDDVFADQRLGRRTRLWAIVDFICNNDVINRADVMRIGEVSTPQASYDLGLIQKRLPGLIAYNKHRKLFERIGAVAPTPAPGTADEER